MKTRYRILGNGRTYTAQVCKWYWPFWIDIPDRRNAYRFYNLFNTIDRARDLIKADREGQNLSTKVVYEEG